MLGLIGLWESMQQVDYQVLLTRRISQNALETIFGSVRQQGGNAFNPTPIQFYYTFK